MVKTSNGAEEGKGKATAGASAQISSPFMSLPCSPGVDLCMLPDFFKHIYKDVYLLYKLSPAPYNIRVILAILFYFNFIFKDR